MITILLWILLLFCIFFLLFLHALYARSVGCTPEQKRQPVRLPPGDDYRPYHQKMQALVDEMEKQPFETVTIRSRDGLLLYARYLHVRDGAPVVIQVHGYRSGGIRDFCGGNKIAREHGFNTLLIEQRAHGRSGGNTLTFGIRERYDILDWIRYLLDRFGSSTSILLAGISMGASAVLMASELDLPENVKGITADSPFTSPEAIVRIVIRRNHLPDSVFFPLVDLSVRLFGHTDLRSASAIEAVKKAKIPILLLHGTADHFVPYTMSRELLAACASPARLELFEGAPHGIGYILEPERYEKIILDFFASLSL